MLVMCGDLHLGLTQVVTDGTSGHRSHPPAGGVRGGARPTRASRPWAGDPWVVLVDLDPPLLSDVLVGQLARPDLLVVSDAPPGVPHDVRITAPDPPSPGDPATTHPPRPATAGLDPVGVVELHLPAGSRVRTPTGARHRVIELECADVDLLRRALELLCPPAAPAEGDGAPAGETG